MPVVFTLSISSVVAAGTCFVSYITPANLPFCSRTGAMRTNALLAHACTQSITASTIMHTLLCLQFLSVQFCCRMVALGIFSSGVTLEVETHVR